MKTGALPRGLSVWHPATILSTWWWSGLLPGAPGTWGSAATLPFAWLIASQLGSSYLIVAAGLAFVGGLWASSIFLSYGDEKDPGTIVIDETAGQFLTLVFVPLDLWWYAAAFILFRLADIFKPWPASLADKRSGPFALMVDDIVAAVYALVVLYSMERILGG